MTARKAASEVLWWLATAYALAMVGAGWLAQQFEPEGMFCR